MLTQILGPATSNGYIDSPSVARGLRYFSTQRVKLKFFNHKPLGEWLNFYNLTLESGEIS